MAEPGRSYGPRELLLVEELARRAALAVDNAQLYREAQSAIGLRDELLAMAAHELRTPVTVLLGAAQMIHRRALRDATASDRDRRGLQMIVEQADRLSKLIDLLLELSRLQRGAFALDLHQVDLCAIARRVIDTLQQGLHYHQIELVCAEDTLLLEGDDLRLEQLLQNLIQNGIKYSPEGGPVTVTVERQERDAVIEVHDHGVGIPADAQEAIFERFYRAGNIDRQGISGFGLGLYIVKEVATRHGGSVAVQSTENQGSTFSVRLPLPVEVLQP